MSISFSTLKKYLIYQSTYGFFSCYRHQQIFTIEDEGFGLVDIKLKEMKR
jgi:hypothetical protein